MMFSARVTVASFVVNALLLAYALNGVTWSLGVEMALSIVLPALHGVARRRSGWVNVLVLAGMLLFSFVTSFRPGIYAWTFFLGIVGAPLFRKLIERMDGRLGSLVLHLVILVSIPASIFASVASLPTKVLVQAIFASFVVFSAVYMKGTNPFLRLLDLPILQQLGRISYSFYLYHFVIVYGVGTFLLRASPLGEIEAAPFSFGACVASASFAVTLVLARWSYRFVEVPALALPTIWFERATPPPALGSPPTQSSEPEPEPATIAPRVDAERA